MPPLVDIDTIRGLVSHFQTQAGLAARLHVSQPTVSRWLKGAAPDGPQLQALVELVEELGLTDGAAHKVRSVPVVGYVGAGSDLAHFLDDQGELERVPAPEGSNKTTVAVYIRGNSLGAFFDQWLIFYDDVRRPFTDDLLRKVCVVGLTDGRVLIKKVVPGQLPGFYNLFSNTEPPIYDVEIEWGAVVKELRPHA